MTKKLTNFGILGANNWSKLYELCAITRFFRNTDSYCKPWKRKSGEYTKKTTPKITILEILVYKIQPETIKSKIFTRFNFIKKPCAGFVIKLKCVKILDFTVSGCILYTKISRMVILGLVFLVYFLKLSVGNGF